MLVKVFPGTYIPADAIRAIRPASEYEIEVAVLKNDGNIYTTVYGTGEMKATDFADRLANEVNYLLIRSR